MKQDEFDQIVAETMNDAANESAKDMLDRTMKFATELNELTSRQRLPEVIIDGVLMGNINMRAHRSYRLSEELSHQR